MAGFIKSFFVVWIAKKSGGAAPRGLVFRVAHQMQRRAAVTVAQTADCAAGLLGEKLQEDCREREANDVWGGRRGEERVWASLSSFVERHSNGEVATARCIM